MLFRPQKVFNSNAVVLQSCEEGLLVNEMNDMILRQEWQIKAVINEWASYSSPFFASPCSNCRYIGVEYFLERCVNFYIFNTDAKKVILFQKDSDEIVRFKLGNFLLLCAHAHYYS